MSLTPNFGMNIPDASDIVNLLTQCYPNFTLLDTALQTIKETGVSTATESKSGTVHNIVRTVSDCAVFWFTATSNFATGDTFTVDGSPVTAVKVSGAGLETGDFVINSNVPCIVKGGVLTVLAGGAGTPDASDVPYDNTGSGLTATDVQDAIDELASGAGSMPASSVTYDNTGSGLTATDVQNAIDELKALIPATPVYITTGLTNPRCNIVSGGYYTSGGYVYVDITILTTGSYPAGSTYVAGFPQASGTGNLTPAFNRGVMIRQTSPDITYLGTSEAVGDNQTIHFIGSYAMA